jgi:hypothetical protein
MDIAREVERLQRELESRRRDDAEALELCGKIAAARTEPPGIERAGKIETLLDELVKLVQTRVVLVETMRAIDAAGRPLVFDDRPFERGDATEGDLQSPSAAKIREELRARRAVEPLRVTVHDELEITLTPAKPGPGREAPQQARKASPPSPTPVSTTPPPTLPSRAEEGTGKCLELDGEPGGQMMRCGRPGVLRISCDAGGHIEHVDVCEKHRHAKLDRLVAQGYVLTTPSVLALIRGQ